MAEEKPPESAIEAALACTFSDVGAQVGAVLRCLIEQEVASAIARIAALNAVLSDGCKNSPAQPEDGSPAP